MNRGFSLIEVLVSIGVAGILVAIVIPAISSSRSAARSAICLSNLHQLGLLVSVYETNYKDTHPFAEAGQPLPIGEAAPATSSFVVSGNHWSTNVNWPSLLSYVSPWPEAYRAWICPGATRAPGQPWAPAQPNTYAGPSYSYSTSFVARPSVWSQRSTPASPEELAATKNSEVRSPSAKVKFFDSELAHVVARFSATKDARPLLFADGHAQQNSLDRATAPARNSDSGASRPWHDTPDGVWGRDYN